MIQRVGLKATGIALKLAKALQAVITALRKKIAPKPDIGLVGHTKTLALTYRADSGKGENMAIKVRILRENKKKAIKEQEQLDEGFKEMLFGTLMAMAGIGNTAQAMDIDVGSGQTITVQQLAPKLKADGSPEAIAIAQKLTDALKGGRDYDGSGNLDLGELGLDYDETELMMQLLKEPEELPATQGVGDESETQKDLFQKIKDKLGFGSKEKAPDAPSKKKPKKKKEKTMQQKMRDANKKDNAFDKLGRKL